MTTRRRLPKKRRGTTQGAKVGGTSTLVTLNHYPDGALGEVFFDLDMHREGAPLRTVMNALSRSISLGLQHGVPPESYARLFGEVRFEPAGDVTGHPGITTATSLLDYLAQVIAIAAKKCPTEPPPSLRSAPVDPVVP